MGEQPERRGPTVADLHSAVEFLDQHPDEDRDRHPGRPLDHACHQLLEIVRRRCPHLLPAEPLPTGSAAEPVPVDPKETAHLFTVAAQQAALGDAGHTDPDLLPRAVVWQEGPDELVVEVGAVRVDVGDGLLSVAVPVRCNEVARQRAVVVVDLVVGTPDRPTGLLAAAAPPRGPAVVVDRWRDALVALAWQALLDTAGGVAAAAGRDEDGSPLVPVALTASSNGLAITAQARHEFDRVRTGRVVTTAPGAVQG